MDENKSRRAVECMMRANRMHKCAIDNRVKSIGIHRTQHRILMYLARSEELVPSQKELAEHLDITPAAVTGAIKSIEQDGYIVRTLGHDNRFNEIKITEKGRALVRKTHEIFSSVDDSMFAGFEESEIDIYISFLERIQDNIKNAKIEAAERK